MEFLHSGFRVLGILKQLLLFWLYLSIGFDVTKFSNCLALIFLLSFSSGVKLNLDCWSEALGDFEEKSQSNFPTTFLESLKF